jgi:hypothetical protein
MKKIMKKIYVVFLVFFSTLVYSNVEVTQPNIISGSNRLNSHGNVIELFFSFKEPILTNEEIDFYIGNKKILSLKNETKNNLERFSGRFRFNINDVLTVKSTNRTPYTTSFKPDVVADIVLTNAVASSPKILARVVSENIKKTNPNTRIGDCIFLVNGYLNEDKVNPEKFIVLVNSEKVIIDSSDRVSGSMVFSLGFNNVVSSCDVTVQP